MQRASKLTTTDFGRQDVNAAEKDTKSAFPAAHHGLVFYLQSRSRSAKGI
jgi:hypothetical protein